MLTKKVLLSPIINLKCDCKTNATTPISVTDTYNKIAHDPYIVTSNELLISSFHNSKSERSR